MWLVGGATAKDAVFAFGDAEEGGGVVGVGDDGFVEVGAIDGVGLDDGEVEM